MIKNNDDSVKEEISQEVVIHDIEKTQLLLHPIKQKILIKLIEKQMTIKELSNELSMNPGTIKRHLNALLENDLIFISEKTINKYSMIMKYYRSRGKKFKIEIKMVIP